MRGMKYISGRDIKDIAKDIRKDIVQAVKGRTLPPVKTSVTIKRFSGGSAIDVCVTAVPWGTYILNWDRLEQDRTDPHHVRDQGLPRYSKEGFHILRELLKIVRQYQRDESDTMTDYFNVNFYDHVLFSGVLEKNEKGQFDAAA